MSALCMRIRVCSGYTHTHSGLYLRVVGLRWRRHHMNHLPPQVTQFSFRARPVFLPPPCVTPVVSSP